MERFMSIKAQLDNIDRWTDEAVERDRQMISGLRKALAEIAALKEDGHGNSTRLAKSIADRALSETAE